MSDSYGEFHCRPGECVKCCSEKDTYIPVTLGDLYRAWVYENKIKKRNRPFSRIFGDRVSGWFFFATDEEGHPLPTPVSKIPCYNADLNKKICSVHDTIRYMGCELCPEQMLIAKPDTYMDSPATLEFFKSLPCSDGIDISQERRRVLEDLQDALWGEIYTFGMLMSPKDEKISMFGASTLFGLSRSAPKIFERFMYDRIKYCDTLVGMKGLEANMKANGFNEIYRKLLNSSISFD